jgi:hypothetical protein
MAKCPMLETVVFGAAENETCRPRNVRSSTRASPTISHEKNIIIRLIRGKILGQGNEKILFHIRYREKKKRSEKRAFKKWGRPRIELGTSRKQHRVFPKRESYH